MHERDHLVDQCRPAFRRLAQPIGEIASRDVEAGADHLHLVIPGERDPATREELDLGVVPQGLGIEQQAVHVEDRGPIPPGERHSLILRREEGSAGGRQRTQQRDDPIATVRHGRMKLIE